MEEIELDLDLEELSSAEDFLDYFGIEYDQRVVHVNRLHILQRYHDYLNEVQAMPESEEEQRALYTDLLRGAYEDFVNSDAKTEKVLKIYKMQEPQTTFVSLGDIKL
ncbi:MAG: nitrogenase-stabilizing/protective protein NifW [Granulosicoccaceae bacterium]|jgi:nitrogenase-stabilizing/protective protein